MENENPSRCPTGDPGDTGEHGRTGELGPTGTEPTGLDGLERFFAENNPFVVCDSNIRELLNLTDDEVRLLKNQLDKFESTLWSILLGYTLCFHNDTAGKVFDIFTKRFGALSDLRTIQCAAYIIKRFGLVFPQSQDWD